MVHQPRDMQEVAEARRRLVFEELFVCSWACCYSRPGRLAATGAPMQPKSLQPFFAALPFSLTVHSSVLLRK